MEIIYKIRISYCIKIMEVLNENENKKSQENAYKKPKTTCIKTYFVIK